MPESPSTWEERLVGAVLRHRLPVVIAFASLTIFAGFGAVQVPFDADIEVWFLEDDPNLLTYRDFLDRFEADEITVIGLFANDVFTPRMLAALDRVTTAAEEAPNVHRVRSLANISIVTGQDGDINITPFMRSPPTSAPEAEALRRVAMTNELLLGGLVSSDSRGTALIIEMDPTAQDFASKTEMVVALRTIAAAEAARTAGLELHVAGAPPFDEAFYRNTVRDFRTFLPLTILMIGFVIVVCLRRLSAVIIPLVVVTVSLIWLFGLMYLFGRKIDAIITALPAVILAVGVADSLHVLSDFYRELSGTRSRLEAVRRSTANLLIPCLVTSTTTAGAMLSLLVSDIRPVLHFGWLAATGVMIAFFLSMTLAPILLAWLPRPPDAFMDRHSSGAMARLLAWLAAMGRRRAIGTLVVAGLLVALAGWQITTLRVGLNAMNYFKPTDPVRVATTLVDERLSGTASVECVAYAPGGGLKEPAILARLGALERWLEGLEGVTKVIWVGDQLKEMNRILEGERVLPTTRAEVAQLYLLLEGEDDFDTMVQDDYSVGRVTARVQMTRSHELAKKLPLIEHKLATEFRDEMLRVEVTGFIKLMADMGLYLLRSQNRSMLIAFAVIVLIIGLLLRSPRFALFSMIPNLTPILLGLGFMAAVDIPLSPGTVMIGPIALGLVVDDTVHFLVRLRRALRRGCDLEEGIGRAIHDAGRPIIITSLALIAGFLVLTFGSFIPNVHFGVVISLVIFLALVADLVALPAALILIRPRL